MAAAHPKTRFHWVVFSADKRRAAEARQSFACFLKSMPSRKLVIKNFKESFFPYNGVRIKSYFETLKNAISPDLILTHYRDDRHQDHRLISELTWNTFRNHLILEYEIPKYDGDLGQPNFFVPLEEAVCRRKVRNLLQSFESQRQRQWFDDETFMAIMRLRGMEANAPTRFAEAFYCRKAVF